MRSMHLASRAVGAVALGMALWCTSPAAEETGMSSEWLFQREMKRAETGDIEAQAQVGRLLEEGRGTPADPKEAARWYRLAAEQRSKAGAFGLAMLYHTGNGVEQNFEATMNLLRPLAEDGDALAQTLVGIMTFRGEGVEADPIIAYAWFATAAATGLNEPAAKMALETAAKSMTADQLQAARELAKQYWADYILTPRATQAAAERRSRSELDDELRAIQAEGDRRRACATCARGE